MQKVKVFRCPDCKKEYNSLTTWGNHVQKMHSEMIPNGYSPARYFYYLQTGKDHGTCIVCKKETRFNEASAKYERFCNNPKCKEHYREMFKNRMISKYGKVHLLNDPEKQREMLMKKKNSGMYTFPDDIKIGYASSYEKHFLEMLDKLLHFSGNDIMGPSPHTYYYEYKNADDKEHEGRHFYIPDFYIPSINLEIEIKQNTNTHPKLLKIDHVKELQKDQMMKESDGVNYIKIVEKDYSGFFDLLLSLKDTVMKPNKSAKVTQGIITEATLEMDENTENLAHEPMIDETNYNIDTVLKKDQKKDEEPEEIGEDVKNEPEADPIDNIAEETFAYKNIFPDIKQIVDTLSHKELLYICGGEFRNSPNVIYRDISYVDGSPAAFIDVYYIPETHRQKIIDNQADIVFACKKEYRGKGLISKLIAKMLSEFSSNKKYTKYNLLWTVDNNNRASIELAKKFGFVIQSKEKNETHFILNTKEMDDITLEFRGAVRKYIRSITDVIDKLYDASTEDIAIEAANYSRENKYPVFIVLSRGSTPLAKMITTATGDHFSHSSLSFDISLDPMYSFGTKKIDAMELGFVKTYPQDRLWKMSENAPAVPYSVFVTYVNKEQKEKMIKRLQLFLDHGDRMKYYFGGLVRNFLQIKSKSQAKWFCSEFVADIINAGKTLDKHPSLYRPQQLKDVSDVEFVISGNDITEYNVAAAARALKIVQKKDVSSSIAIESMNEVNPKLLGDLQKIINKTYPFKYGYLYNGIYSDDFSIMDRVYRTQSVQEMNKSRVAICWDSVQYHKHMLDRMGYRSMTLFLQIMNSPDKTTHTINIIPNGSNLIYIEAAYKKYAGIYTANTLNDILSYVVKAMIDDADITDYPNVEVRKIDSVMPDMFGLSPKEYLEKVYDKKNPMVKFTYDPQPNIQVISLPNNVNRTEKDLVMHDIKDALKQAHETFAAIEASLA